MRKLLLILFLLTFTLVKAQFSYHQKKIKLTQDTILLDSLSIVPGSVELSVDTQKIKILPLAAQLVVLDKSLKDSVISVKYRTFGFNFGKSVFHKNKKAVLNMKNMGENPFVFKYTPQKKEDYFADASLSKTGNISRGILFGNNQDLSVNSNFNLQLNGKLSETVNVKAVVSDDNIPIQPEGNTQQLQDFDQVYIQLYNDRFALTAGDYFIKKNDYFVKYLKRARGAKLSFKQTYKDWNYSPTMAAAVSKGKFARNVFFGIEGNQGPYRLKGAENEPFIIILAGTEKVFLDGKLLTRGQNYDYTINYNTAEITFTPQNIITQNSRIIVEFQYSDKNYARMLLVANNNFENEKWQVALNYFNESDSKNQPLQQELSDEAKQVLAQVGDSIDNAYINNIRLVDFSDNLVLYKMIDTTVNAILYDSVLVYSTNPDSAVYQAGFTYVGENKGNYVQVQSVANGKVFQWVAPIGGVPQGNYEPVVRLISPKKHQLLSSDIVYKPVKDFKVGFSTAVSDYDKNTFSTGNDNDNTGFALLGFVEKKWKQQNNKYKTEYFTAGNYEILSSTFKPIQRIRNAEFQRDWNLPSITITNKQEFYRFSGGYKSTKTGKAKVGIEVFNNYGAFHAVRSYVNSITKIKTFQLDAKGSYLTQEGNTNSSFLRHYTTLKKRVFRSFEIGVGEETEQNLLFDKLNTDSLLGNSYDFFTWKVFAGTADTLKNSVKLTYLQRQNKMPLQGSRVRASFSEDVKFEASVTKLKHQQIKNTTTYRKLIIQNQQVYAGQPDEEFILSRTDYSVSALKGFIRAATVYQVGSGMEVKKEFSFIEVAAGKGTYAYLGDLNGNGVKDLNEFDIALFSDQAQYIKVYTPTNQYIRVYRNLFSQSLYLSPRRIFKKSEGLKKFIARFSTRTNWSADRKTADNNNYYNPFYLPLNDSTLVTLNAQFMQRIYFNKTSPVFAIDYGYIDNRSKSLLVNGFQSRNYIKNEINTRVNIAKQWTLNYTQSFGYKQNYYQLFSNKNFFIDFEQYQPKITYQYGSKFRVSLLYEYKQKQNRFGQTDTTSKDVAFINKIGAESRINITKKGSMLATVNLININYIGQTNAALQYEMLEGLQNGINATWQLTIQRNLSKHMQLNIGYQGRTSENAPVIHIGNVQIRAYF